MKQIKLERLDILTKQIVIQSRSLEEIESLSKSKKKLLEAIPSIQPVKNEDVKRMASGFGYRTDPFTKKRRMHKGMDFSALKGTPIYASGGGIVKRAENRAPGYGKHIRIDHGFGYVSLYAHLDGYAVKRGKNVKSGDLIGYVGNTGMSTGPHLHYTVSYNGKFINSQKLKLPSGKVLKGEERKLFEIERIKLDVKLAELRD